MDATNRDISESNCIWHDGQVFLYKIIVTCGYTTDTKGETGETLKHKFVSFAVSNDEHVDENDVHDRDIWEETVQKSENKAYVERMMNTTGLGNPTTCGYFHIWNDRSAKVNFEVEQFFECSGLGVALMISDILSIVFWCMYLVIRRRSVFCFAN